jgi:hypothetical protein
MKAKLPGKFVSISMLNIPSSGLQQTPLYHHFEMSALIGGGEPRKRGSAVLAPQARYHRAAAPQRRTQLNHRNVKELRIHKDT